MHRQLRKLIVIFLAVSVFSACNKLPDHARYIPKDAIAVAGINLKSLSKKIAWNMITGSKLFKEMQERMQKNAKSAIDGIETSGIDFYNTIYVYVKTDVRSRNGNRITGLVPLSDAGDWEGYVKKVFPDAAITQHGERKEANLGKNTYVAWNKHLLIIISLTQNVDDDLAGNTTQPIDATTLEAEIDSAFSVNKDNSVTGNQHFAQLELEGHDISFWLNYDELMTQYMRSNAAEKMNGISLSNALWQDAALTAGFDFVKGKITGDMRYYIPDSLRSVAADFGGANADKDMLDRLPKNGLDMLLAAHISPKGIRAMMDKTGLLGLANIALQQQNMNADYILNAFTGDMSFTMNNFALHTESVRDSFMGQAVIHNNQKPSASLCFVMKINKKENFDKLAQMAKDAGLPQNGTGFVFPIDEKDSVYFNISNQYLIASNNAGFANGYTSGAFTSGKMADDIATNAYGHPWSMYVDIQELVKNIDPSINHTPQDSAIIVQSKQLLSNISVNGGDLRDNAFQYHMDINFINKDENSIINLMDFAMKVNDATKTGKQ
jgi:Domain of unknown function (DUF4836)